MIFQTSDDEPRTPGTLKVLYIVLLVASFTGGLFVGRGATPEAEGYVTPAIAITQADELGNEREILVIPGGNPSGIVDVLDVPVLAGTIRLTVAPAGWFE